MRKQCLTQWDLKWNGSFGLQSGLFDLTRYAEKLGQLNWCNELALSVKWMPVRPSPIHVLWTDEAVFSLVSKLYALQCGREHSGLAPFQKKHSNLGDGIPTDKSSGKQNRIVTFYNASGDKYTQECNFSFYAIASHQETWCFSGDYNRPHPCLQSCCSPVFASL